MSMSVKESLLRNALQAHERLAPDMTDAAVSAFLGNLSQNGCPSPDEFQSAMNIARDKLRDGLLDRKTITTLSGEKIPDENQLATIALLFRRNVPALSSPPLSIRDEIPPMRLAIAALIGALLGTLIGAPIGISLLGGRDAGLLLFPPIGAFLATWALDQASRSRWLTHLLSSILGMAVIAETWAYLSVDPLSAIWRRLSGRNSFVRIVLYLILIAVAVSARRRPTYDPTVLERSLRQCIDYWLHDALVVLAVLIQPDADRSAGDRHENETLAELGKPILRMHGASAEDLQDMAIDVIKAASAVGFEGLEGLSVFEQPTGRPKARVFEWSELMRGRYEVVGDFEEGTLARAEEEPVVFRGQVIKKGIVRKQRREMA